MVAQTRRNLSALFLCALTILFSGTAHAASLAPGVLSVDFSCSFTAKAQGFRYEAKNYTFVDGRREQHLTLESVDPGYFARVVPNAIKNSSTPYRLIGYQDIGDYYGGLSGGGYYRDVSGSPIDGNVWLIESYIGGSPFPANPGIYTKILPGSGVTTDCIDESSVRSQMNMDSPQRPSGYPDMPVVNAASRAFVDRSQLTGSGQSSPEVDFGPTNHDWMNDTSMFAARTLSLIKGISDDDWGDFLAIEHPGFEGVLRELQMNLTTHTPSETSAITSTILENVASVAQASNAPSGAQGSTGQTASGSTAAAFGHASSMTPREAAQAAAKLSIGMINLREEEPKTGYTHIGAIAGGRFAPGMNVAIAVSDNLANNPGAPPSPGGFPETQSQALVSNVMFQFLKPDPLIMAPISGNVTYAKSIYPAFLFEPPQARHYYAGNTVMANTSFAPGGQHQYGHEPLPSQCNPDNPNYVNPATFNSEVLFELVLDWNYLSQDNLDRLKAKGHDIYDDLVNDFMPICEGLAVQEGALSTIDCVNDNLVAESNNPEAILYPPLPFQTLPEPGLPTLNMEKGGVVTQPALVKGKPSKPGQDKPFAKPKILRKTDAYYRDLIDNNLFTMNPAWTPAHRQSCQPTYSVRDNPLKRTGNESETSNDTNRR